MAKVMLFTDDLDPTVSDDVHTVTVTVKDEGDRINRKFQIDLGAENAKKLETALNRFARAGELLTPPSPTGSASTSTGGSSETAEIRAWAIAHGFKVSDRGALPADVKDAYRKWKLETVSEDEDEEDITDLVPSEDPDADQG